MQRLVNNRKRRLRANPPPGGGTHELELGP
jgi:hypothetical protein